MKTPFHALVAAVFALGGISCKTYTENAYVASGYDARDAYKLGFRDGSADRAAGKAHNPHINEPHQTPAAFRKDYLWGYTEGYKQGYGGSK